MAKVVRVSEVKFSSHKDDVLRMMNEQVVSWLEAIGEDAADTAAQKAPVDTGRLKGSISHAVIPSNKEVQIGTNVHNEQGKNYAIYQELGTSTGVVAKHFLQFGATAHVAEYGRLLERILKQ